MSKKLRDCKRGKGVGRLKNYLNALFFETMDKVFRIVEIIVYLFPVIVVVSSCCYVETGSLFWYYAIYVDGVITCLAIFVYILILLVLVVALVHDHFV